MKAPASKFHGFSLIEVVVAVGIFAIAIVGVIGLLAPTAKSIGDVTDTAAATRLADGVASELARLRDSIPTSSTNPTHLDGLYTIINTGNSDASKYSLTAVADGSYVVRDDKTTGSSNPANNDPVNPPANQPRGIAKNNRYFLIEVVTQKVPLTGPQNSLAYIPSGQIGGPSGFLALTIVVKWPYYIGANAATAQLASPSAQSSMIYNIALTP